MKCKVYFLIGKNNGTLSVFLIMNGVVIRIWNCFPLRSCLMLALGGETSEFHQLCDIHIYAFFASMNLLPMLVKS